MKDNLKLLLNIPLVSLSFVIMTLNPVFILPGLIVMYNSLKAAVNGATKNHIKHSCFGVMKDKKNKKTGEICDNIGQSIFLAKDFVLSKLEKDHMKYFQIQTMNMFRQLPKKREDRDITYSCTSQAYTKYLIKKMEKLGYVTDLSIEQSNRKANINLCRFLLGVPKSKKDIRMYYMSFKLTDKKIDDSSMLEVLNMQKEDIRNYDFKKRKGISYLKPSIVKLIKSKTKTNNEQNTVICENNISNLSKNLPIKTSLKKDKFYNIKQHEKVSTPMVNVEKSKKQALIDELKNMKKILQGFKQEEIQEKYMRR